MKVDSRKDNEDDSRIESSGRRVRAEKILLKAVCVLRNKFLERWTLKADSRGLYLLEGGFTQWHLL